MEDADLLSAAALAVVDVANAFLLHLDKFAQQTEESHCCYSYVAYFVCFGYYGSFVGFGCYGCVGCFVWTEDVYAADCLSLALSDPLM